MEIKHPSGPCTDCGSREFVRVWGLYDEHERAPDETGKTNLATVRFECNDCGHNVQVRDNPV